MQYHNSNFCHTIVWNPNSSFELSNLSAFSLGNQIPFQKRSESLTLRLWDCNEKQQTHSYHLHGGLLPASDTLVSVCGFGVCRFCLRLEFPPQQGDVWSRQPQARGAVSCERAVSLSAGSRRQCHSLKAVNKRFLQFPQWEPVPFSGCSVTPQSCSEGGRFSQKDGS